MTDSNSEVCDQGISDEEKDDDNDGFITAKFSPGEKVFAREAGNLYEAAVRKNALKTKPNHHWVYFVHYLGWNSRWDKWMTEDEIEADTEEARAKAAKAKELARKAELEKKEKKQEKEKERKKRKLEKKKKKIIDSKEEKEEIDLDCIDIKDELTSHCELPLTLKIVLADDHEKITRSDNFTSQDLEGTSVGKLRPKRLVHILPATISVKLIITQFVKMTLSELKETATKQKKEGSNEGNDDTSSTCTFSKNEQNSPDQLDRDEKFIKWKCFERDITSLFDESLPKYLLYNQERNQYLHYHNNDDLPQSIHPSDTYPGEFLLRMLVRLPILLSASLQEKMLEQDNGPVKLEVLDLCHRVRLLIVFLQKNRNSCFKGYYRHINTEELTADEKKRR